MSVGDSPVSSHCLTHTREPKGLMALRTYALYSGKTLVKWCIIALLMVRTDNYKSSCFSYGIFPEQAEFASLLGLFIFITAKVECESTALSGSIDDKSHSRRISFITACVRQRATLLVLVELDVQIETWSSVHIIRILHAASRIDRILSQRVHLGGEPLGFVSA